MRGSRLSSRPREATLEKGSSPAQASTRTARLSSRPWGRPGPVLCSRRARRHLYKVFGGGAVRLRRRGCRFSARAPASRPPPSVTGELTIITYSVWFEHEDTFAKRMAAAVLEYDADLYLRSFVKYKPLKKLLIKLRNQMFASLLVRVRTAGKSKI